MAKHRGRHVRHIRTPSGPRCAIVKANGQWKFVKCPGKKR